jgi:hypothetical protein
MGFIEDVVKTYAQSEAPDLFFYWAAISAISAVMKKNVFLDRGGIYKLYPNIYCFLVAASGMKKGIPINLARTLVSFVNNTRVISGRNSIQQVLDDLGKAYSLEGGGVVKEAHGYLLSSELAAFLIKDSDALTILTDIHDTHYYEKEWKYSLKSGKSTLVAPCISLLGATNEEHFGSAVPHSDIGGGFIARTFIVYSAEKGKLNSLMRRQNVINIEALCERLLEISQIKGEFQVTEEAIEAYDEWYYPFNELKHNDSTGTVNRIGDQILKVAMCISLSKRGDLILNERDIKEAISHCIATLNGMKQITMGQGKSNLASQTKAIIRELIMLPDHRITRKKLLMKYWGEFDSFDLDKIVETLQQAGAIEIFRNGAHIEYALKEKALESYLDYKKSIN